MHIMEKHCYVMWSDIDNNNWKTCITFTPKCSDFYNNKGNNDNEHCI